MSNIIRHTTGFNRHPVIANRKHSTSRVVQNKSQYKKPQKLLTGTYYVKPYDLIYPVCDSNFPKGASPFESYVIIEKQENSNLWGSVYFKPVKANNWKKGQFTGVVTYNGVIKLTVDSRNAPDNDISIFTLTPLAKPYHHEGYHYKYQIDLRSPSRGISYISHTGIISDKFIVPKSS